MTVSSVSSLVVSAECHISYSTLWLISCEETNPNFSLINLFSCLKCLLLVDTRQIKWRLSFTSLLLLIIKGRFLSRLPKHALLFLSVCVSLQILTIVVQNIDFTSNNKWLVCSYEIINLQNYSGRLFLGNSWVFFLKYWDENIVSFYLFLGFVDISKIRGFIKSVWVCSFLTSWLHLHQLICIFWILLFPVLCRASCASCAAPCCRLPVRAGGGSSTEQADVPAVSHPQPGSVCQLVDLWPLGPQQHRNSRYQRDGMDD